MIPKTSCFTSLFGTVTFSKKKTWSQKSVLFFNLSQLFLFSCLLNLLRQADLWLLPRRLSSMFSCWLCRVFPMSKGKRTPWFSTVRSLPKLGGLVGNSPVHQFCTVTDFAWRTSSCSLGMTAFTSGWWSTVILMALGFKCTLRAMFKVGGKSCWHFAWPPAGQFVQWLALKGLIFFFFFLPVTYLCL